jgi:hypothetical protein
MVTVKVKKKVSGAISIETKVIISIQLHILYSSSNITSKVTKSNEPPGSITGREFLDQLSGYRLLTKNSLPHGVTGLAKNS